MGDSDLAARAPLLGLDPISSTLLAPLAQTLRLLVPAGQHMSPESLTEAVEGTLDRSRRMRKRRTRRAAQPDQLEYEPGGRGGHLGMGGYTSGGYTSGGYASSGAGGGYSSASDGSFRSAPVGKVRAFTFSQTITTDIAVPPILSASLRESLSRASLSFDILSSTSSVIPSLLVCE